MQNSMPFYRALTPNALKKIDQTGRRILQEVGIKILDRDFLRELQKAGADVDIDAMRVRFEGAWLDEILQRAPSRFTLYSRDGQNDLHLGNDTVYFGNGGRVFRILDMSTGGYRYTLRRDIMHTATLVDNLEHIHFYIIACQAHNLPPENYHHNDFFHAFNRTSKHVMGGCTDAEGARQMCELAAFIAGGEDKLARRPFVSVITNVISPLTIDDKSIAILKYVTARGIPVTCAPAPIAGATAPVTLAGTLSQMHAEALAGVAIAQLITPGAKVLYGAVPLIMDMRTMEFLMGAVEMGMMNAAAVQLAKLYHLPIYASSGLTEAKRPDIQAGFEKTVSNLTVAMSGADFVHLAAGIIDSGNSISYEQYVIDNEILGMTDRILQGITVNEETMAFDVIKQIGPGGNYVAEGHTIDHMMEEFFYPQLTVRCNFDVWEERGRPDMLSRARERVRTILREHPDGVLDQNLIAEIRRRFPGIERI